MALYFLQEIKPPGIQFFDTNHSSRDDVGSCSWLLSMLRANTQSSSLLQPSWEPDKFISKTGYTIADSGGFSHTFLKIKSKNHLFEGKWKLLFNCCCLVSK